MTSHGKIMRSLGQALANHLLGTRTGAIQHPNDWDAFTICDFHRTQLLPPVRQSERSSHHGEVLCHHANRPAIDAAEAEYNTVCRRHFVNRLSAAVGADMRCKLSVLSETLR